MLDVFWTNFFKSDKKQDIKFMKNCPLFSTLAEGELKFVRKLIHKRHYVDGEVIFKPQSGMGMYIILKGRVNILHGSPDSRETATLVSILKEGDFFGELALAQKQGYRNMFALSAESSQLLGFFQPDLNLLLENHAKIGVKIVKQLGHVLSQRLQRAEQKILQAHQGAGGGEGALNAQD